MSLINIINLLGGLGLFLFGMNYMSAGINQVAGNKMKSLLERLTQNRFKGFLLGLLVTCVIQSSSATTVMVMGFLNADIMTLTQATGVILGAHIGTTITAVLIAADVSSISTLCIFIGAAMILFSNKPRYSDIGKIILGFGLLFFGLKYMSGDQAMGVLKNSTAFRSFITSSSNPFLGLLIGIAMCSILQSSSASIGVLQVLALQGLMPMSFAIYMIIGVNVGSAMPLFLSSIGAKTNAKRAAWVYFLFDVVGMIIFMPIALFTPYTSWITSLTNNGSVQVAIAHIIFKTVTAFVLLPFIQNLVALTEKIIPSQEEETQFQFMYIDTKNTNTVSFTVQVEQEVKRMIDLVRNNFVDACEAFITKDTSKKDEIRKNEELINWLNSNITDYLITVTARTLPPESSAYVGRLFHVLIDLERIGDYAIDILHNTEFLADHEIGVSDAAVGDFRNIYRNVLILFDESIKTLKRNVVYEDEKHILIRMRQNIKELDDEALDRHIERLRAHECHTQPGVIFTNLVQDLERTGDHSYNISKAGRDDSDLLSAMYLR